MHTGRTGRWQEPAVAMLLVAVVFGVYVSSRDTTSLADPVWTLNTSLSILKSGDPYLDEYPYAQAATLEVQGHRLYAYPLATPYLVTPAVAVIDAWFQRFRDVDIYARLQQTPDIMIIAGIHLVLASLITALSAAVIYATGRLSLNRPRAALLALIFAFGTSAWSTASRDLWQHTFSVLFLALALYLVLLARTRPAVVQAAGLFLALAYIVRPTNSIPVLLLTLYVALAYPRYLPGYLAAAALVALPFFVSNRSIYGAWLPPYFSPGKLGYGGLDVQAFVGTLISPGRGLLVYSPVFLFATYGVISKVRHCTVARLDLVLLAVIALHWVLMSYWGTWWAGDSYGPRFFTDVLPFLMYFLIPVVAAAGRPVAVRGWVLALGFGLAVLASAFMHYSGGMRGESWRWNIHPPPHAATNDLSERVWDWSDPQFLRGIRPGAVATSPGTLCITAREGEPLGQAELIVHNGGYSTFGWEMTLPNGVFGNPPCGPLHPFTGCRINLAADTAGLRAGLRDAGGILITAGRSGALGAPALNTPVVMPVTVQVLPPDSPAGDSSLDCYAAPADLTVSGAGEQAGAGSFQVVQGPGWWSLEQQDSFRWRWATSPATLYIYSPERGAVQLSSQPVTLHVKDAPGGLGERGVLRISINDETALDVEIQVGQPFTVETELASGWNTVTLALAAGNYRPVEVDPASGDGRELSFALAPINISR